MGMDASDRRHTPLEGIVGRALEADRAGLGHAIGDRHLAHVHLAVDALHHLDRAGRAGHDAGAQRFQVEARKFGMIELGDEHGRHAVDRGAFLLLDGCQRRQRIKAFPGIDHGRTERDGGQVAHHHAEAMIERHRDADAVLLGEPHGAADEIAVVEDVVMGQRHALRRARGAAGELDIDGVVELQDLAEGCDLLAMPRAADASDFVERNRAGAKRPADLNHRAQLREFRRAQLARLRARQLRQQRVQHFHVVGGLERGRGHDRRAADLGKREFELAQAVGRIDGDQDQPRFGGGELGERPFRPVQ